jgi:hypothetical protein
MITAISAARRRIVAFGRARPSEGSSIGSTGEG